MSVFVIPTPFSSRADRSISKKSRYFFVSSWPLSYIHTKTRE
jgi:hypothetical protein